MISEVDLLLNDIKKSKFSPIFHFRAKIGPVNEIQNAIYRVYSEPAHQGLSESGKKSIGGQKQNKTALNANHLFPQLI